MVSIGVIHAFSTYGIYSIKANHSVIIVVRRISILTDCRQLTLTGSSGGPSPKGREAFGFGGTHIFLLLFDEELILEYTKK